jgi:hypothetical protein
VAASELGPTTTVTATASADTPVAVHHETVDGATVSADTSGIDLSLADGERLRIASCATDDSTALDTTVLALPDDWPTVAATQPGEPSDGYVFLGVTDYVDRPCEHALAAMIVDSHGTPVWYRTGPRAVYDLRITGAGELSFVSVTDADHEAVGQVLDPVDKRLLRTLEAVSSESSPDPGLDSHELQVFADGRALSLATTTHQEDLTAWGGTDDVRVIDGLVQARDAADTLLFQWSTRGQVDYEDVPQTQRDRIADGWEYAHVNSVDVDPADGHWVVSLRTTSQVLKVATSDTTWQGEDRAAGEVIWTLGGAASDYAFVGDDRDQTWQGFAGQHSARVLSDGGLAIFDNSHHFDLGTTGDARLAIYDLDPDAGTATLRRDWSLLGAGKVQVSGSVQELADGHLLIGWGPATDSAQENLASVSELDADGQEVLRLTLPQSCWSYRAWKFDGDPVTGTWLP